ncbi:MAG: hypothetical protein FJ087_06920 [Deltaproteobacteria bacterium]|nr:hypothetical protein [Deltaproteobacteria bacterium]
MGCGSPQPERRLLLLEFLDQDEFRSERSMFFPFLKGLARDRGIEALWLCFVTPPARRWDRTEGRTTFVDLPDDEVE